MYSGREKGMVLKKQTVWLLTMLTLMVVLSAYYLYNPPVDVAEDAAEETTDGSMEEIDLADLEDGEWVDVIGDVDTDFSVVDAEELAGNASDFFLATKMEKDVERAQQLEAYNEQMRADEATAQAVAKAKEEYDTLAEVSLVEETVEDMIRSEGFEDAIVTANLDDNSVNVWVNASEGLENTQVVDIIHMVQEHLEVPGQNVHISYK
jgi:stage III sporulation protein AH